MATAPQQQPKTIFNITPGHNEKYNTKLAIITGVLQMCAGGLLIVLGATVLIIDTSYRAGWDVWGGLLFYTVTGIIGVLSKNQSTYVIIAYMVMSFFSAICAAGQTIYDSVAASNVREAVDFCEYFVELLSSELGHCRRIKSIAALHVITAIIGFFEMVIAIGTSVYCCYNMYESSKSTKTNANSSQSVPAGQVAVVGSGPSPYGQNQKTGHGQPPESEPLQQI